MNIPSIPPGAKQALSVKEFAKKAAETTKYISVFTAQTTALLQTMTSLAGSAAPAGMKSLAGISTTALVATAGITALDLAIKKMKAKGTFMEIGDRARILGDDFKQFKASSIESIQAFKRQAIDKFKDVKNNFSDTLKSIKTKAKEQWTLGFDFRERRLVKLKKMLVDLQETRDKTLKKTPHASVNDLDQQISSIQKIISVSGQLKSMKALRLEDKKAGNSVGLVTDEIVKLKKELRSLESKKALKSIAEGAQKALGKHKGLNRQIQKTVPILDNLENELKRLEDARKKAFSVAEIKNFNTKIAQVEKSMARVQKLQGHTKEQQTAAQSKFQQGVSQGISFIKSSVSEAAKLGDKMIEVSNATGMSEKALRRLQGIQTRTSDIGLLDIMKHATAVPEKFRMGFVEAADKVKVVMGDVFAADPKGFAHTMQNTVKNLKPEQLKQMFPKVKDGNYIAKFTEGYASALLALQQKGARIPYLLEVSNKMQALGGLTPPTSKLLALASVFGEVGISSNDASLALTKIIHTMARKPGEFAKFLGIPDVEQFTNLLNTDAGKAIELMAYKLKSMNPQATVKKLTKLSLFNKLGFTGKGASNASNALANLAMKLGDYNTKARASQKEIEKASMINNAYGRANTTMGAQLDMASKAFLRLKVIIGELLAPAIAWLATKFQQIAQFIQTHWSTIGPILLGVAIAVGILSLSMFQLYLAALPISTGLLFLAAGAGMLIAAFQTGNPILFFAAGLFLLLTRRVWAKVLGLKALTIAQLRLSSVSLSWAGVMKVLNNVMTKNPFFLVVTILSVLIGIISTLYKKFEWFKAIVDSVFGAIGGVIDAISGVFSGFFSLVGGGLDKTAAKMNNLGAQKSELDKMMAKQPPAPSYDAQLAGLQQRLSLQQKMKRFKEAKEGKTYAYNELERGQARYLKSQYLKTHLMDYNDMFEAVLQTGALPKNASVIGSTEFYKLTKEKQAQYNIINSNYSSIDKLPAGFQRIQRKDGSVIFYRRSERDLYDQRFRYDQYKGVLNQAREYNKKVKEQFAKEEVKKKAQVFSTLSTSGANTSSKVKNTNLQKGLTEVTASGTKEKNYYINFESFVKGGLNITTNNMQQAVADVREQFENMMLAVLNNTQQDNEANSSISSTG